MRLFSDWRRVLRWTTWTVVWCVVLAAAWYWWTPWGKDWRLERRIESLCGGVLDAQQMLDLAEERRPDTDVDDIDEGADGRWEECRVGDINIRVADIPDKAEDVRLIALPHLDRHDGGLVAPLGSGWSGYITRDATVTVALPCTGGPRRHIVVEMEASVLGDWERDSPKDVDDPDGRLRLAQTAADTAVRAAEEWDCQTTSGRRLTHVPRPVPWEDSAMPAQADGTCAGLPFHQDDRVATVWETVTDGNALIEHCFLGHQNGARTYRLDAHYGPSAQAARADYAGLYGSDPSLTGLTPDTAPAGRLPFDQAGLWASARCPGTSQRALYEISLIDIDSEEIGLDEREDDEEITWWNEGWAEEGRMAPEALAAFAQQSADRHGCTDLRLP
jgi:hypothetical protein